MKNSYIWIVFKKECMDILRDRKTLIITLLLPILLYPMMFLLMGNAITGVIEKAEENTRVVLQGPEEVKTFFDGNSGIQWLESEDALSSLENGEIDIVIKAEPTHNGHYSIELIYDDKKSDSSFSLSYITDCLNRYNTSETNRRLAEMGIDTSELIPVSFQSATLQEASGDMGTGSAGRMLSMVLPMIIVVFLAVGGMATAGDLFAGEKERKTLEPLLCTRAGRMEILVGKYLAVTVNSLISVISSILGMIAGYFVNPDFMSLGEPGAGETFQISPLALALVFILITIMAMVFAGLHVAISTYARTVKEASMYGTFLMLACYMPAFASMFMQSGDFNLWMMFVPVLNVIGGIKIILGGSANYIFLAGSIAASLIFLGLVLTLTRQLFRKETLMFRTT